MILKQAFLTNNIFSSISIVPKTLLIKSKYLQKEIVKFLCDFICFSILSVFWIQQIFANKPYDSIYRPLDTLYNPETGVYRESDKGSGFVYEGLQMK